MGNFFVSAPEYRAGGIGSSMHATWHQEFITVRVCNCHRVSTTAISAVPSRQYDVGNQWWICPYMYVGCVCVNSVVNHNFTLLERTCYCSVYIAYVHIWTYSPLITYRDQVTMWTPSSLNSCTKEPLSGKSLEVTGVSDWGQQLGSATGFSDWVQRLGSATGVSVQW